MSGNNFLLFTVAKRLPHPEVTQSVSDLKQPIMICRQTGFAIWRDAETLEHSTTISRNQIEFESKQKYFFDISSQKSGITHLRVHVSSVHDGNPATQNGFAFHAVGIRIIEITVKKHDAVLIDRDHFRIVAAAIPLVKKSEAKRS